MNFYLLVIVFFISGIATADAEKNVGNKVEKIHWEYPWFKQSFLDLQEDVEEAKEQDKGLILYFHQQGCPYCKKLLNDNFKQVDLVDKLRKQYDFIAINMWGDRSVVGLGGEELNEKSLAVKFKVMFTPTLVFINKEGVVEFRLNGYYAPNKFSLLLDYLELKNEGEFNQLSFTQYYKNQSKFSNNSVKTGAVNKTELINYQQLATKSSKPILFIFSEEECQDCDSFEQLFKQEKVKKALSLFTIFRASIHSRDKIIDLNGEEKTLNQWSNELAIQYMPSLVFFARQKTRPRYKEVFRNESYLRAFHLESVLRYTGEKHYEKFPQFQRYIHERVDQMEQQGYKIDLWN